MEGAVRSGEAVARRIAGDVEAVGTWVGPGMSQSTPETENASTETDKAGPERENPAKDAEFGEVTDEMLPEDVRPGDDNPLAKNPSDEDDGEGGLSLGPDGPQG